MDARPYPARLDGRFDPQTSRWLWLLKWLLAIPHLVVLVFLWIGMFVTTLVAGFAILFTGRYPRPLFTYAVGVMRWSWRVGFYCCVAFGTDRYPPFSLKPDPDYPADLEVDYPEHLSRGLVLVKWWLLAIPQYLVIALLAGGGASGGGGLIALLALIAIVIYAFSGSYPPQMWDLVLGFNRWVFRVYVYAALLRDEYPPFRLDQGGDDPGHTVAVPDTPAEPSVGAPQPV